MTLGTKTLSVDAAIPAHAGIGLRSAHLREVLQRRPALNWVEVHSENYFGRGGAPLRYLEQIRTDYPVSLHGVGLSLGSVDILDRGHIQRLKALTDHIEPGLVSEHLCWSSYGGIYLNDLAPLPYTAESLQHLTAKIDATQTFLGRQILIENPSSYLEYNSSTFTESLFLQELANRTGCGILLDINNLYVSCINHGWNALAYLQDIRAESVSEIHLAGHTVNQVGGREILIDTHNTPVSPKVWRLYRLALRFFGKRPTLIEWDADLPPLSILLKEAQHAEALLESRHEHAV